MKPALKHIMLTLILGLSIGFLQAQTTRARAVKKTTVQKFKPPKLKTSWGKYSDSATITVKEGLDLVLKPLKITDDKNGIYTISSYQFVWKKRGVTEDEQTRKVTPIITTQTDLFRTTPLPEIWSTNISQQLKKGEEFWLLDVVVKDSQGRFMFAPVMKIKIN